MPPGSGEDIYKIPPALKPKSREDGSQRLYYLTAAVSLLSANQLNACLGVLRKGEFGEPLRLKAADPIEHGRFTDAIKHTTCMVLYLMALEQGRDDDMPVWLSDFLASCVRAMDRIIDGITVRDIMKLYAKTEGPQVYSVAPQLILRELGFAGMEEHASAPLREYLQSSKKERAEILRFALEGSRDAVTRKISELVPSDDLVIEGT